jgi:hypothetical protein
MTIIEKTAKALEPMVKSTIRYTPTSNDAYVRIAIKVGALMRFTPKKEKSEIRKLYPGAQVVLGTGLEHPFAKPFP